jgi:FkbM family methyltransferase
MLPTGKQLEGIDNVRELNKQTDYWNFVETPYGRMFLGGHDDGIAMRYLHGYVYEPVSMELWTRSCRGANLVIDVGAHTGIYTLAAYKAGARRVISIEPYYLNAARLILNLHANHLPMDGVMPLIAASDNDGGGTIHVPYSRGFEYYCTTAGSLAARDGTRSQAVQTRRLDMIHDRVHALKIDAEYHTAAILAGATNVLRWQPNLILESFETELTDRLDVLDYRFWLIDERVGLYPAETLEPQKADDFRRNYYASVRDAPTDLLAKDNQ